VTFTAPSSGASASLSSLTATIGTGGLAWVSPAANGTGGPYAVTASAAGAAPVSFALTNLAQPVFTAANEVITYGTNTVAIAGTIAAGAQIPSGNVAVTLDGVAHTAAIDADGGFSTSFTFTHALGVAGSPYAVSYTYHAAGYFLGAQGTSLLTVKPALLTVTATSESMTYGGAVPALTYTYTGLVNGDHNATFTGSLTTRATSSTGVGRYPIARGTLAATGNYTIGTFGRGTLTIDPARLTVTATNESMTEGGTVPALTYTYTGLVNGDRSARFIGRLTTSATSGSGPGSYAITLGTLAAIGNYAIGTFDPGTLTVEAPQAGGAATAGAMGVLTDAAVDGLSGEADFAVSIAAFAPEARHPGSFGWLS
jgi:hypothetical protein